MVRLTREMREWAQWLLMPKPGLWEGRLASGMRVRWYRTRLYDWGPKGSSI
jgi:hypothetical protein